MMPAGPKGHAGDGVRAFSAYKADAAAASDGRSEKMTPDHTRVLVVGTSPINRIVVSRIIESAGLKPISETPEGAAKALRVMLPGTVILDGGADDRDCDLLLPEIGAMRRLSGGATPGVILLSISRHAPAALPNMVDAVVTKPIMPENLQPVIENMVRRPR